MDVLHKATVYPLPQHLIADYEAIDILVCKLMDEAKVKYRKLHTGSIPWSPTYNKHCLLLEYWLMSHKYINYEYKNTRQLIVLQNKLQLTYDSSLNVTKIEEQIVLARASRNSSRKECKRITEIVSLEYRTQLATAKDEAGEMKTYLLLNNINHIEAQRRLFRNIRHMKGTLQCGSTYKFTVTEGNGETKECTDKIPIEN